MTDVRGRPYVARRRSRSAPPRSSSNSSEPNSQDTSNTRSAQGRGRPNKRRYATRRRLWVFFLDIPVAPAFLGVILMVILTRGILLPQVCDLAAVRGTSRALSGFVQVDVCNAAHADDASHPAGGSAAVAAIQRGQAIGQAIHDLIDSYHDIPQYSETVGRIRDLTPPLSTRMIKPSKDGIDILRSTQNRRTMIQFFKTYDSAKKDLRSVIDLAVTEFGGVSEMFDITVRNAYKRPSQYCASLENHVLGRWYSQSSPEASLLSELTRTTAALDPKLVALRQSIHGLHGDMPGDLEGIRRIIDDASRGWQGDETLDREEVGQLSSDFSCLTGSIDKWNQQSLRLESRILHLKALTERYRCLSSPQGTAKEDVSFELMRLQTSAKEAGERRELARSTRPSHTI